MELSLQALGEQESAQSSARQPLARQSPPQAAPLPRNFTPKQDQDPQDPQSTSIVYVIDDSGSMDGDFPEVRAALEEIRDTDMPNTKVGLIAFGSWTNTVFGLTEHSSSVWTDQRIKVFGAKMAGTIYTHPLNQAVSMLRGDDADIKKIIFLTDAQHQVPGRPTSLMYWLGITMDGVAFGNHFKDKFDSLKGAAHSTGGQYRMIVKPLQGTTNDPAVTTKALSEILPESVADDTATLFLVDYSGSILYYAREHREINPALAAAVSAKNSATGAKVGLAAFRSPHLPGSSSYKLFDTGRYRFRVSGHAASRHCHGPHGYRLGAAEGS